jgi:hypothetical protein
VRLPAIEPEPAGKEVSQDGEDLFTHREQGGVVRRFFVWAMHSEPDDHGVDSGREVRRLDRGQWCSWCCPHGGQLADVQSFDQELHRYLSRVVASRWRDSGPPAKRLAELAVGPPFRVETLSGRWIGGAPTATRRLGTRGLGTRGLGTRGLRSWNVTGPRRFYPVGGRVLDQIGRVSVVP